MALYVDTALRTAQVEAPAAQRTFIKSESFDAMLLTLPLATGLAAVGAVLVDSRLFTVLLLADLWLLGYHHVVATYTRLAFTVDSLRRNRFMAVDLLVLVMVATLALAFTAGAWAVATAFLYLQWFHYMRQGYGIARMYFRTTPDGQGAGARDLIADLVIYLVPVYAIVARSSTMGTLFLELPVRAVVLPGVVVTTLGLAAAAATGVWAARSLISLLRGTLDTSYAGFVLSHVAIFLTAYVLIDDVNVGWLAINVWHNLQYVLVVWMVNTKRYASGVDPTAMLISRLSQPGRIVAYFMTCVAISTIVYIVLGRFVFALGGGLALTVGLYMGINFHHYVVDAMIWKRRRTVAQAA
jgi:hypothetical protein